MRTLFFRALVILTVTTLIGGIFFAAVNATSSSSSNTARATDGRTREGGRPHHPHDNGGGLHFPFGMMSSMVIVGIVAAPYFRWQKRKTAKNVSRN